MLIPRSDYDLLAQEITNPPSGAAMGSIVEKHRSEESSELNVLCRNRTMPSMPRERLCGRDVKRVGAPRESE